MNGDAQKIYDAILDIRVSLQGIMTKQVENHNMNKGDIQVLFKHIESLRTSVNCKINNTRIQSIESRMAWMWSIIISVIIGGIILGIWAQFKISA